MLQDQISKIQVRDLADQMESAYNPTTIQRGLDYFRKGRVYNILVNNSRIQATVQGTYRYLVNINLDDFQRSQCSCPVQTRCKHIAAAIFALYALYDTPEKLATSVLTGGTARTPAEKSPGRKAKTGRLAPEPSGTLEEWRVYFEDEFGRIDQPRYFPVIHRPYEDFLAGITKIARSWPSPAKDFFLFSGCLFAMNQADRLIGHHSYYLYPTLTNMQEEYIDLLISSAANFAGLGVKKEYRTYFREALANLREMLCSETSPVFEWLLIYRVLWSNCFGQKTSVKAETEHLDQLLQEQQDHHLFRYNLSVAKAHCLLLTGQEKEAIQVLDEVKVKIWDILPYLQYFSQRQEWRRLADWIRWLIPKVTQATHQEFEFICRYWLEAAKGLQEYDELLSTLKSWLPVSSRIYTQALLAAGRRRTWVDYYLYNGTSPSEINREELKAVEAMDVSLLLPLYHQAVERLIRQKNRPAYKAAVRMLKKLRTCYKKLKQTGDWDRYLSLLTGQYSRLRAFQEELRKGKLIV